MKRLSALIQTIVAVACYSFAFTACTADDADDNRLPDGQYPMTFTTTVEGLTQTRATTVNTWDGQEKVAVKAGNEIKKYTVAEDGKLSADAENTFYWQSSAEKKSVSAWFPYSGQLPTNFTVKEDQMGDDYRNSDFLYAAPAEMSFKGKNNLVFKHLPAKVVVNLTNGDGVAAADVTGAIVTFVNQATTSGTITVDENSNTCIVASTATGSAEITPQKATTTSSYRQTVQALLVPQHIKTKFIKVVAGDNTYYYTPADEADGKLEAGNQYTYEITVQKNGLAVTLSASEGWNNENSEEVTSKEVKLFKASDLKMGDYYYSDGSTSDGGLRKLYADGNYRKDDIAPVLDATRTVIGIVLKVGRDGSGDWKDDCQYKFKDGTPMNDVRGYVLALNEGNDGNTCGWGPSTSVVYLVDDVDMMNRDKDTGFYGYKNTQAIILFNKDKSDDLPSAFPAAYHATAGYEAVAEAPANSSGWFLPSAGQCWYWYKNKDKLVSSFKKALGNNSFNWSDYYWSSSEGSDPAYDAWCVSFYSGDPIYNDWKYYLGNSRVRSCLAF